MFYAAKSGMKTPTKILLTITATAALSVAYPAKADLITNGGFETGDFPPVERCPLPREHRAGDRRGILWAAFRQFLRGYHYG
jgi:hypothetical protein